jgi:hypothetical protein
MDSTLRRDGRERGRTMTILFTLTSVLLGLWLLVALVVLGGGRS